MTQDTDDALSKIVQHLAVAQTYLSKAAVLVAEYQSAAAPTPLGSAVRSTNTTIHSLHMWAEHLAEHGPTTRGDLDAATGLNLTKSGYDRTHAWVRPMTYMAGGSFPDDAVMRIKGPSNGVGRPPVVYFLWSQRWDVHPLFGVGPVKPENAPAISIPTDGAMRGTADLTGLTFDEAQEVIYCPSDDEIPVTVNTLQEMFDGPEPDGPVRYGTMAEWDEAWSGLFDSLAATEA